MCYLYHSRGTATRTEEDCPTLTSIRPEKQAALAWVAFSHPFPKGETTLAEPTCTASCLLHILIPSQSFCQGSWVTNKPPERYTPRTQQLFLRVLNRKDSAEVLRDLPAANDGDENLFTELDILDKQWMVMMDSLGLTKGWDWER